MWRRMALVIASTALISLVAASWIRVHGAVRDSNRIISDRINDTAQSFSRELRGRVDLADALARYLTATDGGAGGVLLRERMLSSPLMVAPRFARNIEAAYRGMWQRWCEAPTNRRGIPPPAQVGCIRLGQP